MPPSDTVEAKIRERAEKLDKYYGHISSCRVVVEAPHRHHHQGNHYHVRVDLTVPGDELVASREPDEHQAYEDVYMAIRDAFDTTRRRLEEYARCRRGEVKSHDVPPHGRVAVLHGEDDYGKIETADGRLNYFCGGCAIR